MPAPSDLGNRTTRALVLLVTALACFVWEPAWIVFMMIIMLAITFEVAPKAIAKHSRYALVLFLVASYGCAVMAGIRLVDGGVGLIAANAFGVIATDTFAYLGGKKFGRTPFHQKISPNKTREGFWIGVGSGLTTGFAALLIADIFTDYRLGYATLVPLAAALPFVAVYADLFESSVKRRLGIKDFSRALGAHGGFMDRFDAMTAVFATVGMVQLLLSV